MARAGREAGADVALICPRGAARDGVARVRTLAHVGPLTLIRALETEEQLRTIDAVVSFGRRAPLALRAVPHGLRGERAEIGQESDPRMVNWTVREHVGADVR